MAPFPTPLWALAARGLCPPAFPLRDCQRTEAAGPASDPAPTLDSFQRRLRYVGRSGPAAAALEPAAALGAGLGSVNFVNTNKCTQALTRLFSHSILAVNFRSFPLVQGTSLHMGCGAHLCPPLWGLHCSFLALIPLPL